MTDKIYEWLKGFPGLELLQRQQTDPVPGGCGLYLRGITGDNCSYDLLGGIHCRKTLRFRLSRYGDPLESPVFFILLGAWVEDSAPTFGLDQTVFLEKARCVRDTGQGLSLWEAELEITYWEDV